MSEALLSVLFPITPQRSQLDLWNVTVSTQRPGSDKVIIPSCHLSYSDLFKKSVFTVPVKQCPRKFSWLPAAKVTEHSPRDAAVLGCPNAAHLWEVKRAWTIQALPGATTGKHKEGPHTGGTHTGKSLQENIPTADHVHKHFKTWILGQGAPKNSKGGGCQVLMDFNGIRGVTEKHLTGKFGETTIARFIDLLQGMPWLSSSYQS